MNSRSHNLVLAFVPIVCLTPMGCGAESPTAPFVESTTASASLVAQFDSGAHGKYIGETEKNLDLVAVNIGEVEDRRDLVSINIGEVERNTLLRHR